MNRFMAAVAAAGMLALVSGCATVTGSTAQSIAVETRSQAHDVLGDASCRLTNSKGTWFVKSPGTTTITRSNDPLNVNCEKEGHAVGSITANSATRGAIFGNIIAGGVIGAVIDHSTGSAYEYPNLIRVIMGSAGTAGPPDLSGDGQPPAVLAPVGPAQAAAKPVDQVAKAPSAPAPQRERDPSVPARMPQIGDTWKYRHTDRWTNLTKGPIVHEVIAVTPKQIREYSRLEKGGTGGIEHFMTPEAEFIEYRLSGMPEFSPFLQAFDVLEKPGYWQGVSAEYDSRGKWAFSGQAVGKEVVSVPAGTFTATRVELNGRRTASPTERGGNNNAHIDAIRSKYVVWYVPEVKRVVKYTRDTVNWNGKAIDKDTYELVEYKLN